MITEIQSETVSRSARMHLTQFAKVLVITGAIAIAHCQNTTLSKSSEQVSLVIVFDTTASMSDDLVELRTGAAYIVRNVMNKTNSPIYNYIFVPFNDPGKFEYTRNPEFY